MGNRSGGGKKDSSTLAIAETDNSLSRLYYVKKGFKSKIVSNVQKLPRREGGETPSEFDDKTVTQEVERNEENPDGIISDPSKKVKEVNRIFKKHQDILQGGYFVVNPSRKFVLPKRKDCENVYWVSPPPGLDQTLDGKEMFTPLTPQSPVASRFEQEEDEEDLVNTIEEELYRQAGYVIEAGDSGRIEFTEVMSNPLLSSLHVIKSSKEKAEEEIEDFRETMRKRKKEEEMKKAESRRFLHTNPLFGGYESTSSDGEGVTTETDGLISTTTYAKEEQESKEEEEVEEEVEEDIITEDKDEDDFLPPDPNLSHILPPKEEEEIDNNEEIVVIKEEKKE